MAHAGRSPGPGHVRLLSRPRRRVRALPGAAAGRARAGLGATDGRAPGGPVRRAACARSATTSRCIDAGPRAGMVAAALKLRRMLMRRRPAVVHANGVKAALVAVLATPGTGIPVLWLKHDYSWDGPLARAIAARSPPRCAVSGAITDDVRRAADAQGLASCRTACRDVTATRARGAPRALSSSGTSGADAPVAVLIGRAAPGQGPDRADRVRPGRARARAGRAFLLLGGEDPTQAEYARAAPRAAWTSSASMTR